MPHRTRRMPDPKDDRAVRRPAGARGKSIDERTRRLRVLDELADLRRRQAMASPDLPASVREDLRRRSSSRAGRTASLRMSA